MINLDNINIIEKVEISEILSFLNNIDNNLILLEKDIDYLYKNIVKNKSILMNIRLHDSFSRLSNSLNKATINSSNSLDKLSNSMRKLGKSFNSAAIAFSVFPQFANAVKQAQKLEEEKIYVKRIDC